MAARNSTSKPIKTATQLKNLKPKAARYEVADAGCPGLRIRVLPTGKVNYVWYARSAGKRHVVSIGSYPDKGLADARRKLERMKGQHKAGLLFNDGISAPTTVTALCEVFYTDRIKASRSEAGAKQARMMLDKYIIPGIGKHKLSIITPVAVGTVVQTVVKKGYLSRAESVTSLLKQLFKFAVARGYIEQSPAYALSAKDFGAKTSIGSRVLSADDIRAFWSALGTAPMMSDPVRVALKALLLSGVRSGELRLAKWEHIDLRKKTWFIPEDNSKTTEWTVPLSSHLVKQFKLLKDYAGDSAWVLPGKDGPITDKVLNRAMSRLFDTKIEGKHVLTIERASPHDLRRTLRTNMDDLGVEPHIAEKCLNHSLGRIEGTYNKNQLLTQRRDALEKWGDYVDLIVTERENVRRLADAS